MSGLELDVSKISSDLIAKQKAFDLAMDSSREARRSASLIITKLHNDDIKGAKAGLKMVTEMLSALKSHKEFEYHTKQAQQEFAEAKIFFGIKVDHKIPTVADVGIDGDSYLMGLMDVFGELKREIVGALANSDIKIADYYYSKMVEMFDATRSIRFAEAVLSALRRKQDVARIQMESSASELLSFKRKR